MVLMTEYCIYWKSHGPQWRNSPVEIEPTGREGYTQPPPPTGFEAPPMGKIGKTGRSDSRTPFRIHFCKRKTARGMLTRPILNFSQGDKTLVPRALFHWSQQGRGIRNRCSKGESVSHPASALSTELPLTPRRWELLHISAPPLIQAANSSETTLLEISWDRPRQVVQKEGEHTHNFLRRLNTSSQGVLGVPPSWSQQKLPLKAGEGDTSSAARS